MATISGETARVATIKEQKGVCHDHHYSHRADTAQAMDKIVERLGEDALILETVKRNGRIEMIATDSAENKRILWVQHKPQPRPRLR